MTSGEFIATKADRRACNVMLAQPACKKENKES